MCPSGLLLLLFNSVCKNIVTTWSNCCITLLLSTTVGISCLKSISVILQRRIVDHDLQDNCWSFNYSTLNRSDYRDNHTMTGIPQSRLWEETHLSGWCMEISPSQYWSRAGRRIPCGTTQRAGSLFQSTRRSIPEWDSTIDTLCANRWTSLWSSKRWSLYSDGLAEVPRYLENAIIRLTTTGYATKVFDRISSQTNIYWMPLGRRAIQSRWIVSTVSCCSAGWWRWKKEIARK